MDITGHVKPSVHKLHSAEIRSAEFRSETSMVPALQPHPVGEWMQLCLEKRSPNCSCWNLVVEDLCLHVGFCNIQDPGRGIRGEQSKFPSCSLTDFINIFFDFLGFLKVCGSYLAELCKNPKQPVDINSGPAKNLYDDKTSIVSSS